MRRECRAEEKTAILHVLSTKQEITHTQKANLDLPTYTLTNVDPEENVSLPFGGLKVVDLVVDLQPPDASGEPGLSLQEACRVPERSCPSEEHRLGKGYPGEQSLGPSLFVSSVVELKPDPPVVPVDSDPVPSVKVDLVLGANDAGTGAAVKPEMTND